MLEIFRREYGKDRLIRKFASWEEMFSSYISEETIKGCFGYNPTDIVYEYYRIYPDADRYFGDVLISDNRHRYIVYENGDLVTPDTIIGWHRYIRHLNAIKANRKWLNRHRRRTAWRGHRKVRTTHERRWAHAWDDEEHMIPVRGSRRGHNLPNSWDDTPSWNQKCWKKQSKRPRQWKPV